MIANRNNPLVAMESEIISRLVGPERPFMSKSAARELLRLKFAAADVKRMRQLSDKARKGKLTVAEGELADSYERIGSMLAVLQSKARRSLHVGRSKS